MHTVKLKVNDRVYDKLIWLLSKFNKDEIEIIPESSNFVKNQKYLAGELNEILKGKAIFIEMDETEQRLENIIKKHENTHKSIPIQEINLLRRGIHQRFNF